MQAEKLLKNIEQIIPGITRISPEPQTGSAWQPPNLYLVGDDPLTLIDAGYDREEDVRLVLETIGEKRLDAVIITHGHVDHAGGAWQIREATGARVLAHPADWPSIERRFPGKKPDEKIEPGQKFPVGGHVLQALLLPGHTPGHLALLIEAEKIIFSADLVTGEGSTLVAPPEGNMKTYLDSLQKLRKMDLAMILPGHGSMVTDPKKRIALLIEHRELREICLAKCMADRGKPVTLKQLVRDMYLGFIHPQMEGPAAWTAWAHLEKLTTDGLITARPEAESNPFNQTFDLTPEARARVRALFG